ncbi:ORF6N domain-containing protein [Sphingobacterium anhuiense]|uniref:ORF6N domain-containing protein n=1 Tax=Sphingobacterium anhuiense TaxID=493780 RepID=UPI003C30677B
MSQFKVQLKRQVSRNLKHFPSDFIFELTRDEHNILRPTCLNGNNMGIILYLTYFVNISILLPFTVGINSFYSSDFGKYHFKITIV